MTRSNTEQDADLQKAREISDEITSLCEYIKANQHSLSTAELNKLCDEVNAKTNEVERITFKYVWIQKRDQVSCHKQNTLITSHFLVNAYTVGHKQPWDA